MFRSFTRSCILAEMNKGIIISIVIGILAVTGVGAAAIATRQNVSTSTEVTTETETSPSPESTAQKKTLKDLMGMNNQQCTITLAGNHTGEFYISSGKVRGNFAIVAGGQSIGTHIIVNSEAMYMWVDGQSTGYKTDINAMATPATGAANTSVDLNQEVEYSCEPWNVDASFFVLPSSITFTSMSALMPSGNATNKAAQCAACDQAPESARAACKTALSCN